MFKKAFPPQADFYPAVPGLPCVIQSPLLWGSSGRFIRLWRGLFAPGGWYTG